MRIAANGKHVFRSASIQLARMRTNLFYSVILNSDELRKETPCIRHVADRPTKCGCTRAARCQRLSNSATCAPDTPEYVWISSSNTIRGLCCGSAPTPNSGQSLNHPSSGSASLSL